MSVDGDRAAQAGSFGAAAAAHERGRPSCPGAAPDSVRVLLDTHPALVGSDDIDLPYLTRCFRTRLATP